jgi:hypothetical protein
MIKEDSALHKDREEFWQKVQEEDLSNTLKIKMQLCLISQMILIVTSKA